MQFGLLTVGGFGMLLAMTQDSDNPEWDHRSQQLRTEEGGPRWPTWAAAERG